MPNLIRGMTAIMLFSLILGVFEPGSARAEDAIEKAGIGVGVTAGNMVFLPAKAISVSIGLISSSVALIFSGGNVDLAEQIFRDTTAGPYLITPALAKKAAGERPELRGKN